MTTSTAYPTFEEYTSTWLRRGLLVGATLGCAVALFDPTGTHVVAIIGLGTIIGTMSGFLVAVLSPGVYNR